MGIKIVLRKRKNADGTRPLILQVFKNGKPATKHLPYSIKTEDWDRKAQKVKNSHPNSVRLNNYLRTKLNEATDGSLSLEADKKPYSAKAIIKKIEPATGSSVFVQADAYIAHLKSAKKYNEYTAQKPRVQHFKDFRKNEDLNFSDLTPVLLEKFAIWLRTVYKPKGKKKKRLGERSVQNHLSTVRSIFAYARNNGVVKKEQSPFGEDGVKINFPDTNKVPIDAEDIASLETVDLRDPRHDHARKLWLFSFYFAGMRVSDVFRLRWADFTRDRLHYSMGKNDKGGSLKIPEKAVAILRHYEQFKDQNEGFVFPELVGVDLGNDFVTDRTIAFKTSALDKILREHVATAAKITRPLTMHISRHSFADLASDTIQIQQLQKLYRHSDVKTTIGYQSNFIHKDADAALDAVLGKVKKNQKEAD